MFIGGVADSQTGNVPVDISVKNHNRELVVGETVYVDVAVGDPIASLAVPASAVHDEGEGPSVTIVRDGKAVVMHPQVGETHGGWTAISGGDLSVGDPVVVDGAYNLPDGSEVEVREINADEVVPTSS